MTRGTSVHAAGLNGLPRGRRSAHICAPRMLRPGKESCPFTTAWKRRWCLGVGCCGPRGESASLRREGWIPYQAELGQLADGRGRGGSLCKKDLID
eukprot:scaffold181054_cov31-Tisochrysis_lutea.AAC.2